MPHTPRSHRWSRRRGAGLVLPFAVVALGSTALAPPTASFSTEQQNGDEASAETSTALGLIASVFDDQGDTVAIGTGIDGSLTSVPASVGAPFTAAGVITVPSETALRTIGELCFARSAAEPCTAEARPASSGEIFLSGVAGSGASLEWRIGAETEWRSVPLDALTARDLNLADDVEANAIGIAAGSCDGADADCDGIPGSWEENGYTVEHSDGPGGVSVVAWDPDRHDEAKQVKFVSSPLKASTNGDPFTDFQKATGLQLDPRITLEARHPLVVAAPDIEAVMTGFDLIPNVSWSNETGGDRSKAVTQTTDRRTDWSNTVGVGGECGVGGGGGGSSRAVKFECKLSLNYSHTWGGSVGYSASDMNSSTERWNSVISGNNAQSALLMPEVYYENSGTAPIVNAYPQFTISLGKDPLMSASTIDGNKLGAANPGQRYPATDVLRFWQVKDFRDPIYVDQSVVDRLQDHFAGVDDVLKLRVDGYDAKVTLIDESGQPIETSTTWAQQNSLIDASTAAITVTDREGSIRRKIAAPGAGLIESSIPATTLGRALELAFGARPDGDGYRIGERVVNADDYEIISDQRTLTLIQDQKLDSIWDLQLTADMQLTLHAKQQTSDVAGFERYHATLTPNFTEENCVQSGCWILIKPKHAPTGRLQASIDNGSKADLVPWPYQPGVYAIHGSYLSQHYPGNMRGRSIVLWDGDTKLGSASLPKLQQHADIDFGE